MTVNFKGRYDGKNIVLKDPLPVPMDEDLDFSVDIASSDSPKFADLLSFGVDSQESPTDLAEQHDHYLYGHPKR